MPEALPRGRAWRGWLWIVLLVAFSVTKAATESPAVPDVYSIPTTKPDRRGTEQQPLVVSKAQSELDADRADQAEHSRNEGWSTNANIALTIFTAGLWIANLWLIIESKRVSARQARDTRAAIREANRSANAMQSVAEATRENAALMTNILHKQMRAYVSVDTGSAVYQDGRLKFGSSPVLTNTGFTPARNIRYRLEAAILDAPVAPNHVFSDAAKLSDHDASLSPRQTFIVTAVVKDRFSEVADIAAIMLAEKKRLFTWGTVTYEDVFGGQWETRFCHHFNWYRASEADPWRFGAFYHTSHNSAT